MEEIISLLEDPQSVVVINSRMVALTPPPQQESHPIALMLPKIRHLSQQQACAICVRAVERALQGSQVGHNAWLAFRLTNS